MLRQPLVDERVVGVQQVEHAAILAHDAVEEQLGLALEGLPQVVVEVGEDEQIGIPVAQLAQEQPLSGEVGDQRLRSRIGEHPPDLPLQDGGILAACPASAACRSSSSGMLLQRKNDSRDASSTSVMR